MHIYLMQYQEWIKGCLKTLILKLLAENKLMYGYQLNQEVERLSEGRLQLTEGALYPALHKLESEGMVITEVQYQGKRMRKYYRLTPSGEVMAREKVESYFQFIRMMIKMLTPRSD